MMQHKTRRNANAGFTLVELLVGVMILAIVVAPLLHAIVTSANVAKKSREAQNATLASKNVIETLNAMEISQILSQVRSGAGPDGIAADAGFYLYSADDGYTEVADPNTVQTGQNIYYIGLKNITSANSTFDAMVKLDASGFAQNAEEVSIHTPMNAVFSQPDSPVQNPDALAAADMATEATLLAAASGVTYNADDFRHSMVRKINITVDVSGSNVTAEATYSYKAPLRYISTPEEKDADGNVITPEVWSTVKLPLSKEAYTYDFVFYTGNISDFNTIHFFYYPNYNTTFYDAGMVDLYKVLFAGDTDYASKKYHDNITLVNNTPDLPLPFTFFLIKQYTPGISDGYLNTYENQYKSVLALMETRASQSDPPVATLYTNMTVKLGTGNDLFFNDALMLYYNGRFFDYGSSSGKLVASDDLKRLFQVTVSLYPTGTYDSGFTGTPKMVLDASMLD